MLIQPTEVLKLEEREKMNPKGVEKERESKLESSDSWLSRSETFVRASSVSSKYIL